EVSTHSSLASGFDVPRGGYEYVVVSITIANGTDSSASFGPGDFVVIDPITDGEYGSQWLNLASQPLRGGTLNTGEYTYGELVYEVHRNAEQILIRFRPSIFGGKRTGW
ncbi:MAG: DUF4352 domain-containing protein, partial [Chloroflexia bacterium]|nr:DUF4352 domain-containing protein [Chloroflexia bacterium]